MPNPKPPVVVALVNDIELVLHGLAAMLRPFRDRIEVVELDVCCNPKRGVDLALFDAYGHAELGLARVASLARASNIGAVVVYTDTATIEQRNAALAAGARGVLSKSMRAGELAEALISVAGGLQVVSERFADHRLEEHHALGYKFGLTARESEVAALLARGLSNKALAEGLWISEHTVKTHLKSIFQKTDASSRSEAIVRLVGDTGLARRWIA